VLDTAIVSSLGVLLASRTSAGASSRSLSLSLSHPFFCFFLSRMPMLMKETRLTRQRSIAEISHARDRARENLYRTEREREREFYIARYESFQLVRTSSETRTQGAFFFFSPSLSFSFFFFFFFYCVISSSCLSSRTHRIELLIVRPTDEKEREINIIESQTLLFTTAKSLLQTIC
jgi:hypothetical protein